jgi:hypothetical protein
MTTIIIRTTIPKILATLMTKTDTGNAERLPLYH